MDEVVLENKNRKVVMTLDIQDNVIIKCYEDNFLQLKLIIQNVLYYTDEQINSSKYAKFINNYLKNGICNKIVGRLLSTVRGDKCLSTDIYLSEDSKIIIHQNTYKILLTLGFEDNNGSVVVDIIKEITSLRYRIYTVKELFDLFTENTWRSSMYLYNYDFDVDKYDIAYRKLELGYYPLLFSEDMFNKIYSYSFLSENNTFNGGSWLVLSREDKIKIAKLKILGQSAKVKYIENDGTVILE